VILEDFKGNGKGLFACIGAFGFSSFYRERTGIFGRDCTAMFEREAKFWSLIL
jgi:hypothetical protein